MFLGKKNAHLMCMKKFDIFLTIIEIFGEWCFKDATIA